MGGVVGGVGKDIGGGVGVCIDIVLFVFVMGVCGLVIASCVMFCIITILGRW